MEWPNKNIEQRIPAYPTGKYLFHFPNVWDGDWSGSTY